MIDERNKIITLVDENNKEIKVRVMFEFEVEELNKKYIVYTPDFDTEGSECNVIISEFDSNTYEIKPIPDKEKEFVLECYTKLKESLLSDSQ